MSASCMAFKVTSEPRLKGHPLRSAQMRCSSDLCPEGGSSGRPLTQAAGRILKTVCVFVRICFHLLQGSHVNMSHTHADLLPLTFKWVSKVTN